ncbi:MAG: glycosyltransferase family 4 protein [Nitrososphaerales archaeon]
MRILFVVHQFFPVYYTGTERLVLNLAKQMQRMGHYVKVLTYAFGETDGFRREGDFLIKEYQYQGLPVISIRHKTVPSDIHFTIFDTSTEQLLEKIFSSEEFDIIHLSHAMRVGSIIRVAQKKKIPIILTLTDFWMMCPRATSVTVKGELSRSPDGGLACVEKCYEETWKDRIISRLNEAHDIMKVVDFVAAPTYFLADRIKTEFNRDVKVVRHGIDYVYYDIKPNENVKQKYDNVIFGYIGTILPHKGLHIVMEALKLLKNENIRVKIYGHYFDQKEYHDNLVNMTRGDDRVVFLGQYKDEDLNEIMNEIDCILVPSIWWENSPLTALTSLAFKVPVLTTNVGGVAELVKDGVNGFNFEIGNPASLAKMMKKITENPEILSEIKSGIVRPRRLEEEAFEYEEIMLRAVENHQEI